MKKYIGKYDQSLYWERVKRNLGWMGNSVEEQKQKQEKLRDAVVGIAGCGGIGGAVAERLIRLGIRKIKIADPDTFDHSNINRQLGASVDNIGKNKAEVVADYIYNITRDVEIDCYPEGITQKNANQFVEECDYIADKIEFYNIKARYALHRAFRESKKCQFILKCPVIGHQVFIFKYTHQSMPIEEVFGLSEDCIVNETVSKQLMERLVPEIPSYPGREMLDNWFIKNKCCPIFAGCPPLAQGILVERLALEIIGILDDKTIPSVQLPIQPGYAMFNVMSWEAKLFHGKWWDNN